MDFNLELSAGRESVELTRTVYETCGIMHPEPVTDYREVNRAAYDALADKYKERQAGDVAKDQALIEPFVSLVRGKFKGRPIRVLDVGCGNGLNVAMFVQEGFQVTGIDISPRMLSVARQTGTTATLVEGDFLGYPFSESSFDGVFAKAIIHLFPLTDARRFLAKVHRVLEDDGVLYVTTTVDSALEEGFRAKRDYDSTVIRYRRSWPEAELMQVINEAGFEIVQTGYNAEPARGKKWFNLWASKIPRDE